LIVPDLALPMNMPEGWPDVGVPSKIASDDYGTSSWYQALAEKYTGDSQSRYGE
jgi:hypothetical protein